MQSWFNWKGKNSRDMGLWINSLPPESRAPERVNKVKIPGRSGTLTQLEGDNVYDSYTKECTVIARRDANFDVLNNWLRGSGDLIFSSNPNRAYDARIVAGVDFENISNDLCQADIVFLCQPLKKQVPTESTISIGLTSTAIFNPGTVPSKPRVQTPPWNTASIAGRSMTFAAPSFSTGVDYYVGDTVEYNMSMYRFTTTHTAGAWNSNHVQGIQYLFVDCEAKMVIAHTATGDYPFTGTVTGEFWEIPVGSSTGVGGLSSLTVWPRWRWA